MKYVEFSKMVGEMVEYCGSVGSVDNLIVDFVESLYTNRERVEFIWTLDGSWHDISYDNEKSRDGDYFKCQITSFDEIELENAKEFKEFDNISDLIAYLPTICLLECLFN